MKNIKNEILELRKNGKTYNEIVTILNCSKGTISYHCKNMKDNDKILLLNIEKNNYDKLIEKTGISKDKIIKICRVNKISDQTKYQKPTSDEIKDMQDYYNTCNSLRKVSKKFNYATSTISKYLKINRLCNKLNPDEYKKKRKKDQSKKCC